MGKARPKDLRAILLQLKPYFAKSWLSIILVCFLAVLSSIAGVLGTYMLKPIINNFILPGNTGGLVFALIFMGANYLIGVLGTAGYARLMVTTAQKIIYSIRADLFDKVQKLPLRYFDTHTHGELMSRFTNDIDTVAEALNNSITAIVQSFITVVATFIMLFILDFRLSILVLFSFIVMMLFLRYSSKISRKYFSAQQKKLAEVNGFVEEMVSGQKVVKVFNHEDANLEKFTEKNESLRQAGTGAVTYSAMVVPVIVSISYVNYVIVACLGAFLAISGAMDLGSLASYLVFVRQTAMPMNQFTQQINILMAALAGAEHIFDVVNATPEIDEGDVERVRVRTLEDGSLQETTNSNEWAWKVPGKGFVHVKGGVVFEDVEFSYVKDYPILKNMSLYAKPGQKIAFVGSTGAGKTTITNLVNRFYDINSGRITYDGIDIKNIKKKDLRASLSVVLQDTHLFSGTIIENIRYGNLEADDSMVKEAAKLANADSFIRRLPKGYQTVIAGDGGNLSAGQRQLLAITRAAVADPPVLILDEATSSIDTYTERLVNDGMDRLMVGRTVFVIAHRLSTVRNANMIVMLEHGEIIERGTHDQLVAQKGRYYQLYTGQFELA